MLYLGIWLLLSVPCLVLAVGISRYEQRMGASEEKARQKGKDAAFNIWCFSGIIIMGVRCVVVGLQ